MSGDNNSFVRKEMISERVPPAAERGLVRLGTREDCSRAADCNAVSDWKGVWLG